MKAVSPKPQTLNPVAFLMTPNPNSVVTAETFRFPMETPMVHMGGRVRACCDSKWGFF